MSERRIQSAEHRGEYGFLSSNRMVLGKLELSLGDQAAAVTWLEPDLRLVTERGTNDPFMVAGST